MAMSKTLQQYLARAQVQYDLVPHEYANSSLRSAEAAHVPGAQLAKPVIFEDEMGYLMTVLPATHRVDRTKLEQQLHRRLGMALETELDEMFRDCAKGAVPPVGQAYGVRVIWDDSLSDCSDIYFEAGDHRDLVHVSGKDFRSLMANAEHARFSYPA